MEINHTARRAGFAALLSMAALGQAGAQGLPDAATRQDAATRDQTEQRRADERERRERDARQPTVNVLGDADPALPQRDWPAQESPCFAVERVVLRGDAAGAFGWLQDALTQGPDAATGRCLGAQGASVAATRAQAWLIERGFVTSRVLVESQDLSGGTLTLTLLPGRIGAIRFTEDTPERATLSNAMPARPGDVLNLRDIEHALENLRRVPTVQADIQITPGTAPGESDLLVRWQQALPLRLNLTLDDSGSPGTGRYQASTTISVDHWWTLNDLFYVTHGRDLGGGDPGDRGTRNASLHYSLPMGHWALALDASRHRYFQQVAGLAQDYRYSGRGAQQSATLFLGGIPLVPDVIGTSPQTTQFRRNP